MSLLTKIFIIMVFMAALVALGVQATLFSQRVDWKDKFVKETHYHYQTINMKDGEIAYHKLEVENRKMFIDALHKRIDILTHENAIHLTRIADLERINAELLFKFEKLLADMDSFTKQLEVQLAQIKDRELKLMELRDKVSKMIAEKNTAIQELQYVRQELERVAKDLASLEERHVVVVKDKRKVEETLEELRRRGFDITSGLPQKAVDGKVMSYSAQAGVAIINQGKDSGVLVGMKFTIYRGDKFVATGIVKETARDWAAITIELKYIEPQVGDDVSNHILMSTTRPPNKEGK
jgi:hypothetical protein